MSEEQKVLILPEMVTVSELAEKLDIPVTKLIGELFKNGIVATLNQRIDFETAEIIIEELGFSKIKLEKKEGHAPAVEVARVSGKLMPRPPIVAVMGHVDHGKTTLLDKILGMSKANHEAGGITQHISAYQTERKGHKITFLDTPGHETFAAIRQHGAVLTDVVIVVVAADDGVKPQTVESIKFAKDAHAKIVVAINKIDRPDVNVNLVMSQLATEHGLNPEEWGGDTIMVPVSAKSGEGVDKLLDMVLLVADMEELTADSEGAAEGLIIEARRDAGRGSVARVLVQHGNLKVGDYFVAGPVYGRVRTINDWQGKELKSAGPSTPVLVTGFREVPQFGDRLIETKNEREARALAEKNYDEQQQFTANANITGSDMLRMMNKADNMEEVYVIIKADVQGSLASVTDSLKVLNTNEVTVKIVASGVGNITEGDVRQAEASNAIIYGFNVGIDGRIKQNASRARVDVRLFNVIYELIDDVKDEMSAKLTPEVIETEAGALEVKGVFRTTRNEVICGGLMTRGKAYKDLIVRIWRKKEQIGAAIVVSVQKNKDEVKELIEGDIGGLELKVEHKIVVEIGDRLEFILREVKKRSL
jgi:translation initiation factor IF-2